MINDQEIEKAKLISRASMAEKNSENLENQLRRITKEHAAKVDRMKSDMKAKGIDVSKY